MKKIALFSTLSAIVGGFAIPALYAGCGDKFASCEPDCPGSEQHESSNSAGTAGRAGSGALDTAGTLSRAGMSGGAGWPQGIAGSHAGSPSQSGGSANGTDAGIDAEQDAGGGRSSDAGSQTDLDAGTTDARVDADSDAGVDAGPDAEVDAGTDADPELDSGTDADPERDASIDVVEEDAPVADASPDVVEPDVVIPDAGTTDPICLEHGIRIAWSCPDATKIVTSLEASDPNGNTVHPVCDAADDLDPSSNGFACCYRTSRVEIDEAMYLIFRFGNADGTYSCTDYGCGEIGAYRVVVNGKNVPPADFEVTSAANAATQVVWVYFRGELYQQ